MWKVDSAKSETFRMAETRKIPFYLKTFIEPVGLEI